MKVRKHAVASMRGITYTERIPIVRKDFRHKIKETVVVIAKDDCLEGDLS